MWDVAVYPDRRTLINFLMESARTLFYRILYL